LAFAAFLLLSACGYHTAGHAVRLPDSVHTIAIPAFENQTHAYRIEQVLTSAVVRELNTRGRYHIVPGESPSADATLRGVVTSATVSPLTYDSTTGRASSALVTVNAQVRLLDRNGKALYQNPNYVFRDEYQVSREITSFFDEESAAVTRLSRDFARTLVSDMLEAF
jgi:outer membrane lipopolysaccharide assembly protein LptE/RlpB